jgi:uncharacterized membrane protein
MPVTCKQDEGTRVSARLGRWGEEVRTRLWPLPVVALVVAVAVGTGLPRLDEAVGDDLPSGVTSYLFSGGAGAARTVLEAIAGSLITVTSLTFSLTVLTLQLASSQYSPRLLRTFTRDRFVHRVLALFVGSFVFALTVLRTVRTAEDGQDPFVPQMSVTLAFLLTLASALALVLFLAHLAREIRVETVMRTVHEETSGVVDRALDGRDTVSPDRLPGPPDGRDVVLPAAQSGFVLGVHGSRLCEAATAVDAVVVLDRPVGDAVVAGTPVARAWSLSGEPLGAARTDSLADGLAAAVRTGFERTMDHDLAFGMRQLTDVVVRALSPGINDPTTAVHGLNHLAALLVDLAGRDLGPRVHRDGDGVVRVVVPERGFAELLDLAVTQPRTYGAEDAEVLHALLMLLWAVACAVDGPEQAEAVRGQLERVRRTAAGGALDEESRARLERVSDQVEAALTGR